jgi:hypothetical protein
VDFRKKARSGPPLHKATAVPDGYRQDLPRVTAAHTLGNWFSLVPVDDQYNSPLMGAYNE